eukprot:gene15615-32979_t
MLLTRVLPEGELFPMYFPSADIEEGRPMAMDMEIFARSEMARKRALGGGGGGGGVFPSPPPLSMSSSPEAAEIQMRRRSQHMTENMVHEEIFSDIEMYYEISRTDVLGTGASGAVRTCIHKGTALKYALKTLDKRRLKDDKLVLLRQEIRFMAQLDHPNIVRLHECFETQHEIYLVMELCTGGELLDRLQKQHQHHYSEHVACKLVHTILGAVRFCHERHIVHRDLKLENFLFENESPDSELKLIDFGLSQHFERDEIMRNPVGTAYYVAPEVLEKNYSNKCDIWSIGVIAYMLVSGTPPFAGSDDSETLQAVKAAKVVFHTALFRHITAVAKDFISKCLTTDVLRRPTAEELQHHPWFTSMHDCTATVSPDILRRLRGFQQRSLLSRLCLEVVAHTLSPDQIKDLRQEFTRFDKEEAGDISYENLKQILRDHGGFQPTEIDKIFEGVDFEHT